MDPASSAVVIGAALAGLLVVAGLFYLVVRSRREQSEWSESRSDLLRLEQPRKGRPAPAPRAEPSAVMTEPPPDPMPLLDDPELVRLHERAKRRARTVVREIMMYNEEKLEKGRREGNVCKYLGREIEMSRKLYQASIDLPDGDSARYFDESLLTILAGGDASLLKDE